MLTFTTSRNRDAWNTFRGYVYQVHLTIERWLDLQDGQTLELERGEDIDIVDIVSDSVTAIHDERQRILEQVKHREESITLRKLEAITAVACFLEHQKNNPDLNLRFRYTTNVEEGQETPSPMPSKTSAIAAWKQIWQGSLQGAAQNAALQGIRTILLEKVETPPKLNEATWKIFRNFITNAHNDELLDLICRFEWKTGTTKASSLRLELQKRLIERQHATDDIQAEQQYQKLFVYLFQILCEPGIKKLTVETRREHLSDTLSESDHQLLKDVVVWVDALEEGMEALEQKVSQNNEEILLIKEKLLCLDRERSKSYAGQDVASRVKELLQDYAKLFVGREDALSELDKFLTQTDKKYLTITAPAGFGKTALLANWIAMRQDKGYFIAYHFFQRDDITRSVSNAYRNLLRQLHDYYELSDKSLPTNEDELRDKLRYLLENYEVREDKPLVIVVDGLDEASPERSLSLFLPQPLPKGLYVIVSVRVNEVEKLDNLNLPPQVTQKLHLNPLLSPTIADWLRRTGNESLVSLAQDETFVAQVCHRTEGRPIFLKYLIDELVEVAQQGEESAIRKTLAATPKGFPDYIRQQYQALDRLEDWRSRPDLRKIFYFLTVAKGELSSNDLVELMGESPVGLPWRVSRWFKIRHLEECLVFSFAHSTLAEQFAILPEIKANTKKSQKELIKYCADWQEHQSRYVLRHYAEHLRDVKRWEELYAIARDKDFAVAQREQLPDEPDLSLKTVQAALLGAAETDNAGAMAEFMLVHARQLMQTTVQESPLDALRAGSLERALALADLYEPERCVLWYLLLVWELKDTERLEEARETLERLQRKELPRFSTHANTLWQGNYAVYLLAYVFVVNKDTCNFLVQQLFENYHRRYLCKILCEHDDFDAALETADTLDKEFDRVLQLAEVAKAQAGKGQKGAARSNFAKALKIIRKANLHILWVHEMLEIAKAQIEELEDTAAARNTLVNALETAQEIFTIERKRARSIENKKQQKDSLEEIARTEAEVIAFINDALKTAEGFENQSKQQNAVSPAIANVHTNVEDSPAGLEIAETMDNSFTQEEKLGFIAKAQAEASQTETARATFASALQIAQGAEPTFRKALALSDVAEELVKVEQKELGVTNARIAHQIAQRINKPMEQAIAIAQVAKVLAKAGKRKEAVAIFDSAIEIAQNINIQQERVSIFRVIAQAQTRIEDFAGALQTAQKIEWPWIKAEVLGAIAKAQAAAGQWKESQETFSITLETPGFFAEEVQVKVFCARAVVEAARDRAAALDIFRELLEFAQESGKQRDNYLSTIAAAQAEAGEIPTALNITDEIEDGRERVKALLAIAWEQFNKKEKEILPTTLAKAFQAKDKIEDEQKRLQAIREIAGIQAMAGKGEEAVRTVEAILTDRNWHLPGIASWFVETGDRMNFKRLLIPCAYYLEAAYEMCSHLARLYPEKAEEIAKVVSELN